MGGSLIAIVGIAGLTAAMLPFRSDLNVAIPALLLLVPVVVSTVVGGYVAGAVGVVVGCFVLDILFEKPFQTVTWTDSDVWVALAIYFLVMMTIAWVVDRMRAARATERDHHNEIRELVTLSGLQVTDLPLDRLLPSIVNSLAVTFDLLQVALFVPDGDRLRTAASAGMPLCDDVVDQIASNRRRVIAVDGPSGRTDQVVVVPLLASGSRVGILAFTPRPGGGDVREPMAIFANKIALAIERANLRERAAQLRLAEEKASLAKVLVATVSHDLRSPLATIKTAASILADDDLELSKEERHRLTSHIDVQADRLGELVQGLLDMSRIESGAFAPSRSPVAVAQLIDDVLEDLAPDLQGNDVVVTMPADLPLADIDGQLIGRVLTNLIVNAATHGPRGTPITIGARSDSSTTIEISVTDCGQGVRPERRTEIFDLASVRRDGDAGSGLGLIIARTFVEAHGECIWVTDAPGGGSRFTFTIPSCPRQADPTSKEMALVAVPHH
jgi:two-component system, OmpR family, sensor histidine kinase KdpD